MKNYPQAYVKNSLEAADLYCRAFGARKKIEMKTPDGSAYEHCEIYVGDNHIIALSENQNPCDINVVHKNKWVTMTFNVFEMGTEEAVKNAFNLLSEGGVVLEDIHEVPWSKCCAMLIDKFGVCWWMSI